MVAALPADMQPAQDQPQRVEAVLLAVAHELLCAVQGAEIGLIGHLQRIQRTGGVVPQTENALVQIFLAGACGEHGVAVFAGGAVQATQICIKGHGGVGIAGTGGGIDQFGQQRAGAGEQNVDGFHGSFPYVSPRQRGKSIIYIQNQYSISKVPLPLKRFFWPKYCKKGQKQQPKAVFRALGCCFSQVLETVSGTLLQGPLHLAVQKSLSPELSALSPTTRGSTGATLPRPQSMCRTCIRRNRRPRNT